MKYLLSSLLCLGLLACQNQPAPNAGTTTTANADSTAWINLLDGNSTDQWRSYGGPDFPAAGWVMDGDELVIQKAPRPRPDGFGGDLITKEQFGNFELQLKFMMTDTANSGIFYFVQEEEGSPIWFNAPEFQILDDETYVEMGTVQPQSAHLSGGNYDLHAAPAGLLRPPGEWNSARILHRDGQVEHWLNGTKAVEYTVSSPEWEALVEKSKFSNNPGYGRAKTGHIGLQDHDYEVRFKNIRIRAL